MTMWAWYSSRVYSAWRNRCVRCLVDRYHGPYGEHTP